jgi:hypothetical protein
MEHTQRREQERAWVISSVGLPDFPYLAERGNVGLYVCKGVWVCQAAAGMIALQQPVDPADGQA